jgi:UDP-2,3-diacylglucosamine pyrophosphatase LpxH
MLVVISDLHLTDGTSGATISPGAFNIFAERLRELAQAASWRSSGAYRPIERVDLVLLGDVLDVIRSSRWAAQDRIRPWDNPQLPDFIEMVTRITGDILRRNDPSLAVLRGLAAEGGLSIPAATAGGQPAYGILQPVPVRIHYLVGNHDWMFHIRGPKHDGLRQMVAQQMGLANRADIPFPHDPNESPELIDTMRRHKVFARHGDVFDPFNFEGRRDASSLGDVIVIELLNRFASMVEAELVHELPVSCIAGLREIDNVRPLLLVPVWIDGLLERTCPFPWQRQRVKQVWDQLADNFLSLRFVRERDTWSPTDLVDGLQRALKFSKRIPVQWASSILSWVNEVRGVKGESYYAHALAEQDFRNRRAQHIVYGHTHHAESVPLDASYAEGYVLNQTYFNSGTWRRVHRQTELAPSEHEFIPADVMTYLAFFQADERSGRPYETWSGTLGITTTDVSVLRVDPGSVNDARVQPISTPSVREHAPHFSLSTAGAGIVPTRRV